MSEVRIYLFYIDSPNITLISINEEKIVKRKWLIDICSEFAEEYILSVDDMATLVAQTCELHSRPQSEFICRHSDCDNTYVYHSGKVK